MENYLLSVPDVLSIYDSLLSSINTIWGTYVFVLLGMVGWILARAHEFKKVQKILITIIFSFFNIVSLFYFRDAYADIGRVRQELVTLRDAGNLKTVPGGISSNLIEFNPIDRLWSTITVVVVVWGLVIYLVWARKIWQANEPTKG